MIAVYTVLAVELHRLIPYRLLQRKVGILRERELNINILITITDGKEKKGKERKGKERGRDGEGRKGKGKERKGKEGEGIEGKVRRGKDRIGENIG
jgi:hypothetical protein